MNSTPSGSLPVSERISTLDVLRGFALMGILIMNMPGFSYSGWHESDGSHYWPSQIDQVAEQVRDALFSGKFNSLFSVLFGLGFTIQFARMQQQDPLGADRLYLRRLSMLFVIGVLHACVFWSGDVLHVYALLGILLLFGLRRVSDRGLVMIMIGCLVYPLIASLLRVAFVTREFTASRVALGKAFAVTNDAAFGAGSFWATAFEHMRLMAHEYGNLYSLWGTFGWYVSMTLTMLLGVLAGRRRWALRIPELMPQIKRLTWVTLVLGLALSSTAVLIWEANRAPAPSLIKTLAGLCYNVSRPMLMVFYVLVIVQLFHRESCKPWFKPFELTGRMPLTNYLMQSAICTTLFYGWGFGLWAKVGPAAGLALSVAIFFGIQVPWSWWWLRTHERGPMEALWARMTYGQGGGKRTLGAQVSG
ncbi:MAG: DUF418 domain-containing protein [Rubrivivax sp.]